MGDFNAKIGKEEALKRVAGKYSLHDTTSENGMLMAQCAEMYRLHIKSTSFPHKIIQRGTWRAPGRNIVNQIDHVLISARHSSDIIDVRSLRGPNCDSDHYLVKAKLRQKIAQVERPGTVKRTKWCTDKLRMSEVCKKYQESIDREMEKEISLENDKSMEIDTRWK